MPTVQATISADRLESYIDCVQRISGSDNPVIFVRESSSSDDVPELDFVDLTTVSGDP